MTTMEKLSDRRVVSYRVLPSPTDLEQEFPLSERGRQNILRARRRIEDIISRRSNRLLVIVGPCSIHNIDEAVEYANHICVLRNLVGTAIEVVMRVYFEKPRTTIGWEGLVMDPDLNGSCNIAKGLRIARQLLVRLAEMGIPCATEFLDPVVSAYIAELVSWGAIGARTIESQTHRQMAAGLSVPIGLKNGTMGNGHGVQRAVDAMVAVSNRHMFLGIDRNGIVVQVEAEGNPFCHLLLRGGDGNTNHDPQSIAVAMEKLVDTGLSPVLMVDCSHANSQKKHENQAAVLRSVITQRLNNPNIIGVMLESNLHSGQQKLTDPNKLQPGISITDACIGWEETEGLILWVYDTLGL